MSATLSVATHPLVVVAEPLAAQGVDQLKAAGLEVFEASGAGDAQLGEQLARAQALIVRSKTVVSGAMLDAAPALRVIGRAGVGVDAIDVEAATRHGILVLNTPDASTLATAEHTIAMMLALARNLVAANQRVHAGSWSARDLAGVELAGKTLGVVGLGRIGAAVALRARALQMIVLGHDAVVSDARAESLGVRRASLEELLRCSDFVTLHVPLTEATRSLIGAVELDLMKPTAYVINCARGGLIDEAALERALDGGTIAGAALDVVATEPPGTEDPVWRLLRHPKVLATPHLGGSTKESQARIAVDLCRDIIAVLRGAPPAGAVNAPINAPSEVRPFVELAYRLGRALPQMCAPDAMSRFSITLEGDLAGYESTPFCTAFLSGLLPFLTDQRVSPVNAQRLAGELGVMLETLAAPCERGFTSAIAIRGDGCSIAGTTVHASQLRIVEVDGFELDIAPQGYLVLTRHRDVPGIVGQVGTILGAAKINISSMQVARRDDGQAMMVLGVDRSPPPDVLERLRAVHDLDRASVAQLS